MTSSNKNNFSASDIERYYSGEMPAEEGHALEKAALDDPFLADALEGYAFTSTAQADLATITQRLNEKTDRKKTIPFFKTYKWLSAAAVFIVLAGAGWLVYTNSSNENQSLANKKQPFDDQSSKENINAPVIVQTPFTSDSSSSNSIVATSPKQKQRKVQNTFDDTTNNNDVVVTDLNIGLPDAFKKTEPVLKNSRVVADSNPSNAQGQNDVATTKSSAVPNPNAMNSRKEFLKQNSDSNTKDALTGRTNRIANDTIENVDVVLKRQPLEKEEVVVVGLGVKSKTTDRYPRVIIDTLEPAEGYVKFDDYVANNLKMPEEFLTKSIPGEVQLSFDVDKNGKPVNITVVKSLCEKCDEEAIRILKEGPKWKKKKNKKGKITIKF